MSKFVVDLNNQEAEATKPVDAAQKKKRGGCLKIIGILGVVAIVLLLIASIAGYFYWQKVKETPQYSLALIVDAARRDDKEKVAEMIETEEVVNNFVPQITEKAVELYGRNFPPKVISKVSVLIVPLMPAIKDKAKEELPQLIRDKTEKFDRVPYWLIAVAADRALDIKIEGDTANITSKVPEKPLDLKMKRKDGVWKVVGIKDEKIAQKIAEKIGQQLMTLASNGNIGEAGKMLGLDNLGNILKNLNDIFK